jgi:outer membrane lipoprotein-sorting protein
MALGTGLAAAKDAAKPAKSTGSSKPAASKPAASKPAASKPPAAKPDKAVDGGGSEGPAKAPAAAASAPATAPQPAPTGTAATAPVGSAPASPAQAVADGIEKFYAKQPGFRAAFTQVVTKKGLTAGLKREGLAWLRRGDSAKGDLGRMRWDYPSDEIFYFCDGDTLWSYERRERLAVRVPVRHSQVFQATQYLVGQGNLGRDFQLELVSSPLPGTVALKLVPKSGTQLMRSLTLMVDKATFAVKASKLVDPLGDTTDLVWRDVRYEAADDKTFEWSPPAGVTVKDLSRPAK